MLIEVKVPVLSESVTEATLVSWHKKKGDKVERGENLIDIETDKVVMELPAPQTGVLAEILKEDGAMVTGEEVIARIDTTDKLSKEAVSDAVPDKEQPAESKVEKKVEPQSASSGSGDKNAYQVSPKLMPAAKQIAAEHHLDPGEIRAIQGTGRDGRIVKQDILDYISDKHDESASKSDQPDIVAPATSEITGRPEKRVPMTRLRMRIAERLVQSQATAAILTTFNEVNMQAVLDLRARYKDSFEKEHGVKLGLMSFFVKAVVAALKKFPIINASVDGNDIIYHEYFDIGIAVASPRGLVVPILRDADKLSFTEIETQISALARSAQEGKITLEELTGGTFSITNGGVFGSMLSTPIINPPQSAILGIHATKERPVVENGQIVIRPMNYLALSYDHRIIDGREAVLSLVAIKEALEYPSSPLFQN